MHRLDAIVFQISVNGARNWLQTFGSDQIDKAFDATTDQDSNIYVVGVTDGDMGGRLGGFDIF